MTAARTIRRAATLVLRAIRRRCPNCGGAVVFDGWFKMKEKCPTCGIRLERGEQGYQVGAYMLNIVISELIFAAIFITTLVRTWPDPPWTLLQFGGVALMVLLPVLFYPFSKTLFLALDLTFNPRADGDR
ncbi:MAG: DUF983 domain-containing protein [Gemmatimonadales bacterium]